MKHIKHPVMAVIMTLIVGQQWFMVGLNLHDGGWPLALSIVLAVVATTAVIVYHQSSRKIAYFDGVVTGINEALNPTRWRTHD